MSQAANTTNTTRRNILAGLAALPAAAAAPAFAADNPIPALIEAHKTARANMLAAKEARRVLEEARLTFDELAAQGRDPVKHWKECLETIPGFAEAVERSARAIESEEDAFRALLAAAVNHPEGFMELAAHCLDLTEEEEGPALEGASPAYRLLAAFAGRDCWTERADDAA